MYLSLSAEGLHVGGGGYHLDRDQLARYRAAVDDDRSRPALEAIAAACATPRPTSPSHSSLKTAPRGYSADHPRIDLLRQDGIIGIWAHRPGAWLHKPAAKDRVVDGWRALAAAQRLAWRPARRPVTIASYRGARSRMACRVSMPNGSRARAGVVTPLST